MLKVFKLLLGVAALAGFVWFGANIKLGPRTLFEHLQAIGQTRETHDLVEGTRQSAQPLVERVRHRIAGDATAASDEKPAGVPDGGALAAAPADKLTNGDRARLRKLLGSAERPH